jgi:hypothetical protein
MSILDSPSRTTVASISNLSQLSKSLECLSLSDVAEPELFDTNAGKKYHICVCAYALNTGCFLEGTETEGTKTEGTEGNLREYQFVSYNHYYPYLQFLVANKGGEMGFPVLEYICPAGMVEEEGARIKDECIRHMLDTLILPDTDLHMNNRNIIDTFKGFVRMNSLVTPKTSSEGTSITPITTSEGTTSEGTSFEGTSITSSEGTTFEEEIVYIMIDLTLFQMDIRPEMKWAIVDELVYKKNVEGNPVGKDVAGFFDKYNCMGLLHTADEMRAELPFPFQVYMCRRNQDGGYSNVLMSDTNTEYLIEHEKYGVGYLFTSEADFWGGNAIDSLRRYAMFVANCSYVLPDSGTQGNPDTQVTQGTQDTQATQGKTNELKEESNPHFFSTTIYFVENGVQMWFVKNALHFKSIV